MIQTERVLFMVLHKMVTTFPILTFKQRVIEPFKNPELEALRMLLSGAFVFSLSPEDYLFPSPDLPGENSDDLSLYGHNFTKYLFDKYFRKWL